MQINITARITGDRILRSRFKTMETAAEATLHVIGRDEVQATRERIITSKTAPDGQRWRPWSQATLRARQADGTAGRGLLYRTGQLANSIQYRVSPKTVTVYSNLPYAQYLQQGTMRMPARPFIGWSIDRIRQIRDTVNRAIANTTD